MATTLIHLTFPALTLESIKFQSALDNGIKSKCWKKKPKTKQSCLRACLIVYLLNGELQPNPKFSMFCAQFWTHLYIKSGLNYITYRSFHPADMERHQENWMLDRWASVWGWNDTCLRRMRIRSTGQRYIKYRKLERSSSSSKIKNK